MALSVVQRLACIFTVLVAASARKDQTRWSRQISSYTADIGDWIPLPGPTVDREEPPQIKRQAVAEPRILSEPFPGFSRATEFGQDVFPSRTYFGTPTNRQLYLQSMPAVPSAPQNYLSEQGFGQSIRFGLSQPNFPLSQGFISPQFGYENVQQMKPHPQQAPNNVVKFENFPKAIPASMPAKPYISQQVPNIKEAPKFIDGYRAENASGSELSYSSKRKPQSLHKIKFEGTVKEPKITTIPQGNQKVEREEVQLLYVPLEQLNRGQFNFRSPISSSQIMNSDLYTQGSQKPNTLKQTLTNEFQRPLVEPFEGLSSQEYFNNYNLQRDDLGTKFSTASTPIPTVAPSAKPKKLKPHQPPLAIFLTHEASRRNQVKVGDVLSSLKSAKTVAVLDSVNPQNAPSVFIGPSNLIPPENYVKFELPYLSNIDNSDKKLRQLPFFVAPLSYNTPQGFAKIPFPSPHVGSVVINAQIKETPPSIPVPTANVMPNVYTQSPTYKQEQKPVTQKSTVSFYSTAPPRANSPSNYQSNYYSFEPQTVSTVRPPKEPEASIKTAPPKPGSYFMSNVGNQYNPVQYNPVLYNPSQYVTFPQEQKYKLEPFNAYNIKKTEPTTTSTTTTTTPAPPHSTYPSQLLETHNPYSINHAFHFSTPLDYHSYFDETYATPKTTENNQESPSSVTQPEPSPTPQISEESATQKTYQQQSSPNYLQNYSPEIHYESEVQNSRRPIYNPGDYSTKTEFTSEATQPSNPVNSDINLPVSSSTPTYNENVEPQSPVVHQSITDETNKLPVSSDVQTPASKFEYNQYETNYEAEEPKSSTPSTTTTTRRNALKTRGRPRYTTTPRSESNEYSTRSPINRKPWAERRPLPARSRYEPNKITTEKPTRKPVDSNESTTKSSRSRTRGRVHYKPTESDDLYERKVKTHKKEEDLAYQRDVLHQNYPVTLMERTSTVDIEAITEPSLKTSDTQNLEPATETYDAENAYTNERASITQHYSITDNKDDIRIPTFTSRSVETDSPYVEKTSSSRYNEYVYQSRSSLAPVDAISYDETAAEKEEEIYEQPTTPLTNQDNREIHSYATEPVNPVTEQSVDSYPVNNEAPTVHQEESTTIQDLEISNDEANQEVEEQENVVQTTPSYNRVRVRPGVIRQYHQATSTESSRSKIDRRNPLQAVTYRPAFDRRRTTMRIEEIEADLKTKQVHARPDVQEQRHPVYKPEPSTEPSVSASQTTTTKRGHFRRRRPNNSYSTTTTESGSTKRSYEVKNRYRGRRPTTEKPTEKPEVQTETSSTTVRSYNRYSHRPRLSERYNKKPEPEESDDQDSNYSINRPKYIEPETDQWSPKISTDSFKPYNPNDIVDDQKVVTTDRNSGKDELEIITAKNEYDDILISVTPATNSRNNKKIPEIPPTLEALVEQSKVTKSDTGDTMSTFETMLEEVMKSLEEQDEDEYTSNVMKHKGGEIGEIPPESIISSGDSYVQKNTSPIQQETTTAEQTAQDSTHEVDRKGRRRGFWKKVKVRPVTTEAIDVAESQYYPHTINRLGQPLESSKSLHDKSEKNGKLLAVTTYKPTLHFIKDIFTSDDEHIIDDLPNIDIPKIIKNYDEILQEEESQTTIAVDITPTERINFSPGDLDLGTGSPEPTVDETYYVSSTESTTPSKSITNRSDTFSLMDYLFGTTSDDGNQDLQKNVTTPSTPDIEVTTEQPKPQIVTTESSYIPEEITAVTMNEANTESVSEAENLDQKTKLESATEISIVKVESSSVSSYSNPANLVSTSMSTEISHETEICFRGKCIKTSRDLL